MLYSVKKKKSTGLCFVSSEMLLRDSLFLDNTTRGCVRPFTSSLTHIHYSEMVQQSQSCMGRPRHPAKMITKCQAAQDIINILATV